MSKYVGNKGGQGIREKLINFLPLSSRYFSLFYGHGGFENCPLTKGINWICSEKNPHFKVFSTPTAAIDYFDYLDLVADFNFTSADFIFADPPYLHTTRRNSRNYYKHEFQNSDHIVFLTSMISLKAQILITHPECDLYNKILSTWRKHPFRYMSRNGWFNDCLWTNFDSKITPLYNYSSLGNNSMHRQQIKRKRLNFISKFKNLTFHEQQAIMQRIL